MSLLELLELAAYRAADKLKKAEHADAHTVMREFAKEIARLRLDYVVPDLGVVARDKTEDNDHDPATGTSFRHPVNR